MKSEGGRFFPLFVNIEGRRILIVGAGSIAARRIGILMEFGPSLCVVAPEAVRRIEKLAAEGKIDFRRRAYCREDLRDAALVFAATDDKELNARIAGDCRDRQIPVNVCSDKDLCDFQFPSIVLKEQLTVGINASGTDHGLVKRTRAAVEKCLRGEELYE